MRKLLHAIYTVFKTDTAFRPEKFYRDPEAARRLRVHLQVEPQWKRRDARFRRHFC